PGHSTLVEKLKREIGRADVLADQQKAGLSQVSAATRRKDDLKRLMSSGHLRHIVKVAQLAAVEFPELLVAFVLPSRDSNYLEFISTARTIAAEAATHRDTLLKYGMEPAVLDDLTASIAKFEDALQQGMDARRMHVGASADLEKVVVEIVRIVKALDGLNRVKYAADPERLAAWKSATNIVERARPQPHAQDGQGGEVQPAA